MAKQLTLSIGGENVQIGKLDYVKNQHFKKELQAAASELMPKINGMGAGQVDTQNAEAFAESLTTMFGTIDGMLEVGLKLVMSYGRLPNDTPEKIHDDEIIDNFLVVVNAAVPLAKLKTLSAGFSSVG
jgi:hypothetical protein